MLTSSKIIGELENSVGVDGSGTLILLSISRTPTSRIAVPYSLPYSFNYVLGLTPSITSFSAYIRRMIMARANPATIISCTA